MRVILCQAEEKQRNSQQDGETSFHVTASRKNVSRFLPRLLIWPALKCPGGREWSRRHTGTCHPSGDSRRRKESYRRRYARSHREGSPLPVPSRRTSCHV